MNYFSSCNTPEDLKARWKELAKTNHPDLGGDSKVMQEINKQYGQELLKIKRRKDFEHGLSVLRGDFGAVSEEVEPAESYWKKNNIDPYEHIRKSDLEDSVEYLFEAFRRKR